MTLPKHQYEIQQARMVEEEPITPGRQTNAVQLGTPEEQERIRKTIAELFHFNGNHKHGTTRTDNRRTG